MRVAFVAENVQRIRKEHGPDALGLAWGDWPLLGLWGAVGLLILLDHLWRGRDRGTRTSLVLAARTRGDDVER